MMQILLQSVTAPRPEPPARVLRSERG